jgi:hypothetical protein
LQEQLYESVDKPMTLLEGMAVNTENGSPDPSQTPLRKPTLFADVYIPKIFCINNQKLQKPLLKHLSSHT